MKPSVNAVIRLAKTVPITTATANCTRFPWSRNFLKPSMEQPSWSCLPELDIPWQATGGGGPCQGHRNSFPHLGVGGQMRNAMSGAGLSRGSVPDRDREAGIGRESG